MKDQPRVRSIDEYISGFPEEIQSLLEQIRATIKAAAPQSSEAIKYDMPAFTYGGQNLVYFAAFKNHIGFYAVPTGNKDWEVILSPYKTGKGSIQFPYSKSLPLELITKVVDFRLKAINGLK